MKRWKKYLLFAMFGFALFQLCEVKKRDSWAARRASYERCGWNGDDGLTERSAK